MFFLSFRGNSYDCVCIGVGQYPSQAGKSSRTEELEDNQDIGARTITHWKENDSKIMAK
jgi:hypothetical protein